MATVCNRVDEGQVSIDQRFDHMPRLGGSPVHRCIQARSMQPRNPTQPPRQHSARSVSEVLPSCELGHLVMLWGKPMMVARPCHRCKRLVAQRGRAVSARALGILRGGLGSCHPTTQSHRILVRAMRPSAHHLLEAN